MLSILVNIEKHLKLFYVKGSSHSRVYVCVSFIFMARDLFMIVEPAMALVTNEVQCLQWPFINFSPYLFHSLLPQPTTGTGHLYRSLTCPMSGPRDVHSVPHLLTHSTLQSNCYSAEICSLLYQAFMNHALFVPRFRVHIVILFINHTY